MTTKISELIAALPAEDEQLSSSSAGVPELLARSSVQPVPVGRVQRLTALGTLQAKIGAAYLFHWLRGWFKSAAENERLLAEAHWRTALRVLDSMTYLRGAVMKIGQTLANFPDIAPREFVATLDKLHFDAPPMHWSLLREMVHNELGDDPENLFAAFDKQAFAAASLGQVHRARLKSGEEVAVKIQYPGVGRAIDADFRNLFLFMLPGRLTKDWEYTKDQCDDLRRRLVIETDYELEAANLGKARAVFREADGIVIPRVYPEFSTKRILTMERLEGVHVSEFLSLNPSQGERNDVARQIIRAWYRMIYAARITYADLHPGNFLVLNDGRLGVIDFGFVWQIDAEEWELVRRLDRPMTTGRPEDRIAEIKVWNYLRDDETDRLRLCDEYAQWCWLCRYRGGDFDFGDEADMRRGIDLFTEMIRKRYTRARSNAPAIARLNFGVRSMLYQLKAKFDIRSIAEEEVKVTGWDRSDYAGTGAPQA
ncbi:MAG TPA: AarF/ABC1/UbiB kinase family protein [Planctomycetaceae bacterium]|jgi:predicted unusual protein kinase regulating ubiquinone biosynthesis (AarF/ABC1/UbiB family)